MYPAIIVNNGYYPQHLGKELLDTYKDLYEKRLELKPKAKTDKRIKGIVEGLKLSLNSVFGKIGNMDSWLYDKQCMLSVTLTGQFSLLMLIEMYELEGIRVISANTDGVTILAYKNKFADIERINKEWEEKTKFILEKVNYRKIMYSTVNDYIAEKVTDDPKDKIKKKGDFITDFELWKNKSSRVVALALQEYFENGTSPIDFITKHDNIYDFCIMGKASGQLLLEEQIENNGEVNIIKHKKLVRYYLSKNSKSQLYKRGTGSTGKKSNTILNKANDIGEVYVQYFNQFEEKPFQEYGVAIEHYIYKALKMIDKVTKSNKAVNYSKSLKEFQQMALF